jgi:hypothetical protein
MPIWATHDVFDLARLHVVDAILFRGGNAARKARSASLVDAVYHLLR